LSRIERLSPLRSYICDRLAMGLQRGSIENANGVLRRDFPRKTDLSD
jgi:IS30 family transposase